MLYVTGCNGLVGSRFLENYNGPVKRITYRDDVHDFFDSHENSCLLHLAWSSTTRNTYEDLDVVVKNDVINSQKIFKFYADKNPNGKIIFLSSAGDLHTGDNRTAVEDHPPIPKTLYGECKLQVENILKQIECDSVVLRVSNIWGGRNISKTRVNGLIDKLIKNLNTDNVIEIYANLDTRIDIIHIDDLVVLLEKVIESTPHFKNEMYLVGCQSLTIKDVISKISSNGYLLLKFSSKQEKSYLHIENMRVRNRFDWTPKIKLI